MNSVLISFNTVTVDVLKFQTLKLPAKHALIDKQCRSSGEAVSLRCRVSPVCYFDKHFVNSSPLFVVQKVKRF